MRLTKQILDQKKMNFINRKSGALFFLNFVLIEILDSRHTLEDWHKNEKHCILPSDGSVMKTKLTHIFKHLFGLLLILFCVSFGISLGFYAFAMASFNMKFRASTKMQCRNMQVTLIFSDTNTFNLEIFNRCDKQNAFYRSTKHGI